jgi:hypothetical protein
MYADLLAVLDVLRKHIPRNSRLDHFLDHDVRAHKLHIFRSICLFSLFLNHRDNLGNEDIEV